jgi:ribonucleoside-triphosphate reductase
MKKIRAEVYSRCVGYYRPVAQWNPGKKAEFAERKEYIIEEKTWTQNPQ